MQKELLFITLFLNLILIKTNNFKIFQLNLLVITISESIRIYYAIILTKDSNIHEDALLENLLER